MTIAPMPRRPIRCRFVPALLAVACGAMLVVGCGPEGAAADAGGSPLTQDDVARTEVRAPTEVDGPFVEALVRGLDRAMPAMTRAVGLSGGVMTVSLGRIEDHTGAASDVFAARRSVLEEALVSVGARHRVLFNDRRGGATGYQLHSRTYRVQDADGASWVLHLVLMGPGREGEHGKLWDDTLLLPAPPSS